MIIWLQKYCIKHVRFLLGHPVECPLFGLFMYTSHDSQMPKVCFGSDSDKKSLVRQKLNELALAVMVTYLIYRHDCISGDSFCRRHYIFYHVLLLLVCIPAALCTLNEASIKSGLQLLLTFQKCLNNYIMCVQSVSVVISVIVLS